jgi:hypothetical protein
MLSRTFFTTMNAFARSGLLLCLLALPRIAAQEKVPKNSVSPDGKWEFRLIDSAAESANEPPTRSLALVKAGTAEASLVYKGPEALKAVWAPNSKRFALNARAGRQIIGELYQLRDDQWIKLRSLEEDKQFWRKLDSGTHGCERNIWNDLIIQKWLDPNTAVLYACSICTNVEAHFLFTLGFDGAGQWRITKTHKMSTKESEKINWSELD